MCWQEAKVKQTGRMLMGSSHLSGRLGERGRRRIEPPPTTKQPSVVSTLGRFFLVLLPCCLLPLCCYLFESHFSLWGEGGRKGHTTSPICFRVCQLGDSNYRRLEEEDRKRMSNWFGFPPKLHICCCSSSKKRPWVIVTLDLDASSFYLLLFFSLLFDAV